jgi:type II secretory pathway predicted ATPase ExeA
MYERFFGLQERPFDLVPNPRFVYLNRVGREVVANLRHGLATSGGLTLLLGDAGTGKTTLVSQVLGEIDSSHVQCMLLSNPTLTRSEFYEALAQGFLIDERFESKTRFLADFREYLEVRQSSGLVTALVVDEAQSLSNRMLEEIRLLSNMDTPTKKLLNVVLAGQPELAERLNDPRLRHLKQRITLRCELKSLSFAETAAYVAGRLRIAGGQPGTIFSREAVMAVHETSKGIPRTINVVCHNALISGFASQTRPIVRSIIDEVRRDFDLTGELPPSAAVEVTADGEVKPPAPAQTPAENLAVPPGVQSPIMGEPLSAGVGRVRRGRFNFF